VSNRNQRTHASSPKTPVTPAATDVSRRQMRNVVTVGIARMPEEIVEGVRKRGDEVQTPCREEARPLAWPFLNKGCPTIHANSRSNPHFIATAQFSGWARRTTRMSSRSAQQAGPRKSYDRSLCRIDRHDFKTAQTVKCSFYGAMEVKPFSDRLPVRILLHMSPFEGGGGSLGRREGCPRPVSGSPVSTTTLTGGGQPSL